MDLPDIFKGNLTPAKWRQLGDYLQSTGIITGRGIRARTVGNKTILSASRQSINGSLNHPFEILVANEESEKRLRLNYGAIYRFIITNNSGGSPLASEACWISQPQDVTSYSFLNEPLAGYDNSAASYEVLTASTNYGIWVTGTTQTQSTLINAYGVSDAMGYTKADIYSPGFSLSVLVSSTYVLPADAPSDRGLWFYIGKVEVGTEGEITILQHWKSDIILPSISLPRIEISAAPGNSLVYDGTDGLLFVPPIVSTDVDNSISQGTDYGAYYEAPPVVSADANNSISTGSDGGPFYDAP